MVTAYLFFSHAHEIPMLLNVQYLEKEKEIVSTFSKMLASHHLNTGFYFKPPWCCFFSSKWLHGCPLKQNSLRIRSALSRGTKPRNFPGSTFLLSGRSARNCFSRKAWKARACLSQHCQRMWKVGNHLEKSRQFWNCPENWQSSGKILLSSFFLPQTLSSSPSHVFEKSPNVKRIWEDQNPDRSDTC